MNYKKDNPAHIKTDRCKDCPVPDDPRRQTTKPCIVGAIKENAIIRRYDSGEVYRLGKGCF